MRRRFVLAALALSLVAAPASGLPAFLATFQSTFTPTDGTPLAKAQCLTCHAAPGPPVRNPYGKEVETHLREAHAALVTAAVLQQTTIHESDGDGWSNLAEIRAGTLPGDPASHPTSPSPAAAALAPSPRAPHQPLVPLHSFHPLVVHFPIALFVVGALLELLGARLRREPLRQAAHIDIALASVIALAAVATGAMALYRNGFPLAGLPLAHLVFALSAAVGMAATALLGRAASRAGLPRGSRPYWVVLVVTLAFVTIAGHLGSALVYG